MKLIRTQDALGCVLCHDMTQIIKDEYKGPRYKKGHIITVQDIPVLLSMGKENIYVWECMDGMLHENDAALRLAAICQGSNMSCSDVSEGKVELKASIDGLFRVDSDRLIQINSIDQLMIASRKGNCRVYKGDKLCGTRVIPLVINEQKIIAAEQLCNNEPIFTVEPFILKTAGVVTTGSEVFHKRIEDKFTPTLVEKLKDYSIDVTEHIIVDDNIDNIVSAILKMKESSVDMILCTGGMSVDPDDNTPGAIKKCGADIVTYGAPVLPGAMILLGYLDDIPIIGLPGCVMYAKATVFDLILPRIAAGIRIDKNDFIEMGEGGLCLGCDVCTYPDCAFGK